MSQEYKLSYTAKDIDNKLKLIPDTGVKDEGKFLRVVEGVPTWVELPRIEETKI